MKKKDWEIDSNIMPIFLRFYFFRAAMHPKNANAFFSE